MDGVPSCPAHCELCCEGCTKEARCLVWLELDCLISARIEIRPPEPQVGVGRRKLTAYELDDYCPYFKVRTFTVYMCSGPPHLKQPTDQLQLIAQPLR